MRIGGDVHKGCAPRENDSQLWAHIKWVADALWPASRAGQQQFEPAEGFGGPKFAKPGGIEEGGGFAWVHWAGDHQQEEELAGKFETTIRCIPLADQIPDVAKGEGKCILTGQPSQQRVLVARAY